MQIIVPHSYPDLDPKDSVALKECLDRGYVGWDTDLEEVLKKDIQKFVCKDQVVVNAIREHGIVDRLKGIGG